MSHISNYATIQKILERETGQLSPLRRCVDSDGVILSRAAFDWLAREAMKPKMVSVGGKLYLETPKET